MITMCANQGNSYRSEEPSKEGIEHGYMMGVDGEKAVVWNGLQVRGTVESK